MSTKFNPFTGTLDFVGGAGVTTWKSPVADTASLPTSGNLDGDARVTLDTDRIFVWDNTSSRWEDQGITASSIGATPNANGYSLEVDETNPNLRFTNLKLQPADSTNPGIVTTGAQNFAGNKTFDNDIIVTGDMTVNGTTTTINTTNLDVTDANITINNNGNDVSAEGSGLTVERTGVDGSLVYEDTLASKFKAGPVGSEVELANVSSAQTITNKTIDANNNTISNLTHGSEVDNPSSGVHGVTGNVVGDSDTQILTNKTIDGDVNTVQDLALTSLKTVLADADKFIQRDATGVVVSDKSVPTGDVVGTSDTQTLTGKTIDTDFNIISNIADTNIVSGAAINATKIADGSIDNTEFQQLNGVSSNIQSQLDTLTTEVNNKADQDLSNLTSPTAINQDLLPDSTLNDRNIGSSTQQFNDIYADSSVYGFKFGSETLTGTTRNVELSSGDSTSETSGNVTIKTGQAPSGLAGTINIEAGTGVTSGDIKLKANFINFQNSRSILVPTPITSDQLANKGYVDSEISAIVSTGDIGETSFSLSNNASVDTDVTGLAFANGSVRSAEVHYSIVIDATTDLYESGTMLLIQRGADWALSQTSAGDNSLVTFSVTAAGQVQYQTPNYVGFVSGTMKFRAITTSI